MMPEEAVSVSEPVSQPTFIVMPNDEGLGPPQTEEPKDRKPKPAKRRRRMTDKQLAKRQREWLVDNFEGLSEAFFSGITERARAGDSRALKLAGEMLGYIQPDKGVSIVNTISNNVDASQKTVAVVNDRSFEQIMRKLENRTATAQLTNADSEIIEIAKADPDLDREMDSFELE